MPILGKLLDATWDLSDKKFSVKPMDILENFNKRLFLNVFLFYGAARGSAVIDQRFGVEFSSFLTPSGTGESKETDWLINRRLAKQET